MELRRVVTAGVLVIAGAAAGAGLTLWHDRPPSAYVPPASTPVQQVAVSYLTNWVADRCDVTKAMTYAGVDDLCSGLTARGWRAVGTTYTVNPPESSPAEQCVPTEIDFDAGPDQGFNGPGWMNWDLCFTKTPEGLRLLGWGQV